MGKKWPLVAKYLIPLAVMVVTPFIVTNPYYLGNLTLIAIYTIAVSGLGLLMGYTGQVSLGQAAFMGLGAYGSAILSTRGINPWLALLASLTLTAALGWLIGRLALKLHGHFLALATLAAGIIIHLVFQEQSALTGGPSGLGGIPPLSLGPLVIQGERGYFYLTWILALLVLKGMGNLIRSRFGRGLQTIATNEMLARVMGIPVQDYKLKVFVLAAMVSSLAGSLYAHYVTFISPYPFGFKFSIDMVLMAVVGGLSSLWGPFLGAAFFVLASEILRFTVPIILPGSGGELESIFFGVVLVLLIIFRPAGLGRSLEELILRLPRPPVTPPSVGEKGGTGHASTS